MPPRKGNAGGIHTGGVSTPEVAKPDGRCMRYRSKEEIYGATINAIIEQHSSHRDKIMSRLESDWQHLLARETATLRLDACFFRWRLPDAQRHHRRTARK